MARVILLILIIATIVAFWVAFRPKRVQPSQQPMIKGPDDDEEFLWKLERDAFKKRREQDRKQHPDERPQEGPGDGRAGEAHPEA
ncbi:hypothetical protein [Corynebacterium aquilae]|uniref:Uncharacterized protein n=1 Tax=Corynebacterium aquilae DSM 44791 TaxID=1431546 RepID=A0A1L7CDL8_9CORY|nr:hypothetical protein [Corynebacterium aquilae]APT83960.1 hypothetical protein CAQU_01480 [Corynebacterium aquilae DSM 44791]